MPLGMAVGLGPGDIVLDGETNCSLKKGIAAPPLFGPCLLWQNRWTDQDATWYGAWCKKIRREASAQITLC